MGIYSLKPQFRRSMRSVERWLIRLGVSADAITGLGLLFSVFAGLAIWLGRDANAWLLVVPVAVFLRIAANALDGMVAVTTDTTHPRGEVFNETADRLADIAIFFPIVAVPGVDDRLVAASIAAILVTSVVGISAKAAGGTRIYSGVMGKADRMSVIGAAAAVAFVTGATSTVFTAALWIVLVGVVVTFVMRIQAVRRELV